MAEEIIIPQAADKQAKYDVLIPQIEALVTGEPDLIANLANISAALKQGMGFFWVGFYLVGGEELVLGPFQGSVACTRIRKGKGVCGVSWETGEVQLVPDVDQFPGHIACSSDSRSEIVLPIFKDGEVALVLDIDSNQLNDFDKVDEENLMRLTALISALL